MHAAAATWYSAAIKGTQEYIPLSVDRRDVSPCGADMYINTTKQSGQQNIPLSPQRQLGRGLARPLNRNDCDICF